jgi:hypothetical protein
MLLIGAFSIAIIYDLIIKSPERPDAFHQYFYHFRFWGNSDKGFTSKSGHNTKDL